MLEEGAGVVEAVGEDVTHPAVGDTVMLNWRAPCHGCGMCLAGRLSHCRKPVVAKARMRTDDGQVLGRVLGLGTFASHTVIAASQAIVVAPGLDPAATCLIGCGVVTGVGAALFAAQVERDQTVAVFGCGAVGISVIQGARIAGARQVIAVDTVASKLTLARSFGASHTVHAKDDDPVEQIKALTGGAGVDHAFEAVGLPVTLSQALASCAHAGSATFIGVPHPKAEVTVPLGQLFYGRLTLRSTFYGDCLPSRDFPRMAAWYRDGTLKLDEMISERIALEDVDEAFARMQRGETVRSVIDLSGAPG